MSVFFKWLIFRVICTLKVSTDVEYLRDWDIGFESDGAATAKKFPQYTFPQLLHHGSSHYVFESETGHELVKEPQAAAIISFITTTSKPISTKERSHQAVKKGTPCPTLIKQCSGFLIPRLTAKRSRPRKMKWFQCGNHFAERTAL